MLIKPQELHSFDFSPYGRYLSRPADHPPILDTGHSLCWSQEYTFPMGEMRFGIEKTFFRSSFTVTEMEQHRESKELVICGDKPVVIYLCLPRDKADHHEAPNVEDVVSLILRPGDVIVLDEYVWHTGCMPLKEDTFYLFAYRVRSEELYWVGLQNGCIEWRQSEEEFN